MSSPYAHEYSEQGCEVLVNRELHTAFLRALMEDSGPNLPSMSLTGAPEDKGFPHLPTCKDTAHAILPTMHKCLHVSVGVNT